MQADYSLELGSDDPALEMPWQSPDGSCRFMNLKQNPELLAGMDEARQHPELGGFLRRINAPDLPLQTAKCDVWFTAELFPEEEIFGATGKQVSYVDLLFTGDDLQTSLEKHESFVREICNLMERAPETASSVELVVRHCHYHRDSRTVDSVTGFCVCVYVSGYGDTPEQARQNWAIALKLLQNVLVQYAQNPTKPYR